MSNESGGEMSEKEAQCRAAGTHDGSKRMPSNRSLCGYCGYSL